MGVVVSRGGERDDDGLIFADDEGRGRKCNRLERLGCDGGGVAGVEGTASVPVDTERCANRWRRIALA